MRTYRQFFTSVLTRLDIPVTVDNINALCAVATLEGLNDRYNPLNSVVPMGKSTAFNSVGVQDYKSYGNGVHGTVKLLRGDPWVSVVTAMRNREHTADILAAFKAVYATWNAHVDFPSNPGLADQPLGGGEPVKHPAKKPARKPAKRHPAPPMRRTPRKGDHTYTVRHGDTLWNIAQDKLNRGGRWREIADANGILQPFTIYPGEKLIIPAE